MKNLRGIARKVHKLVKTSLGNTKTGNTKANNPLLLANNPLLLIVALSAGIAIVALLPALPEQRTTTLLFIVGIVSLYYKRFFITATFLTGIIWALLYGWIGLEHQLDRRYVGQDLWLTGIVSSLPVSRDGTRYASYQRFEVTVVTIETVKKTQNDQLLFTPGKVRLGWYGGEPVRPGELWRWKVRLKRPRGFSNPAGFDYEGWLFEQGIGATGYIKKSDENTRLDTFVGTEVVQRLRWAISENMGNLIGETSHFGPMLALINGDRSHLGPAQWKTLLDTGTNHLIVISGLHIGLIAVLAYQLVGFILRRVLLSNRRFLKPFIRIRITDSISLQCWAAIIAAGAYTAIAGFSLSTQRAFIMVSVVMLAQLSGRNVRPLNSFLLALVCVLIIDPLAVMSAGFLLSFSAVAALLYVFVNRHPAKPGGVARVWNNWGLAQWTVFVALLPILSMLLLNVSLVSPLANLIAVPVVSLLIVPLTLAGAILSPLFEIVGIQLLLVANWLLEVLWVYLQWLASIGDFGWYPGGISGWSFIAAIVAVVLLLAPKGMPGRWLGILCFLPLLIPSSAGLDRSELEMAILDVGQGLSVSIRTANHSLLYDTGPRFSPQFDAGSAVVVPFLRKQGTGTLDLLLLSHADNDHVGGASSVLDTISVDRLLLGSRNKQIHELQSSFPVQTTACSAGTSWQWDGVQFDLLYPFEQGARRENNNSCVLMVKSPGVSILFTGDIESSVEKELVEKYGSQLKADILIAPHHGSNTSSTRRFIESVSPAQVIISSGYNNRYRHPASAVIDRYNVIGSDIINTAHEGAIVYYFKGYSEFDDPGKLVKPRRFRKENRKYWHSD
ncbi:MAG: DNA internalization-related competence protein ComEC/Rec2 [Pseudomonadales bacterium]|nr:DNA internalization-related competence protein ComEC/Rec2 [Pseudomonadales bacterium]